MEFDRIILLAGGSGASFTFAIALTVLKQAAAVNTSNPIDFIWAVKHQGKYPNFLEYLPKTIKTNFKQKH